MKNINKLSVIFSMMLAVALSSCRSTKVATSSTLDSAEFSSQEFVRKVAANTQNAQYLTAKVKFDIKTDSKDASVTGNIKMKRDDVIQIAIVPFGFIEAARVEFTQENVTFVDRMNKRFTRIAYADIDFFRKANLDFSTIQSLFWAELFTLGDKTRTSDASQKYSAERLLNGDVAIVQNAPQRGLVVKFAATLATELLNQTVINGPDAKEKSQFLWKYSGYSDLNGKKFPQHMHMILDCFSRPIDVNFVLSRISTTDKKWETRTSLSDKYKEVSAEQMLKKILSL